MPHSETIGTRMSKYNATTTKSETGFIIIHHGGSTTETEYIVQSYSLHQAIFLMEITKETRDLGSYTKDQPTIIYCKLLKITVEPSRWQELINFAPGLIISMLHTISFSPIATVDQPADVLTKTVSTIRLVLHLEFIQRW